MSTKTFPHIFASSALAVILSAALISPVLAGPREQAKRIHDRLVGTPPSAACLDQLEAKVSGGDANGAAMDAITDTSATESDACTGKDFYRVTLKNFITPWTNEEQTVFAPLNDYTATLIGIVRDDYDVRFNWYGGSPRPYDVRQLKPGNNWPAASFEAWLRIVEESC